MNKEEYINKIKSTISSILEDYIFNNYKDQIFVQKLGVEFAKTYKEDFLWSKALYLSTKGSFLLSESEDKTLGIKALKASGEVYEYLGNEKVTTSYDKNYCLILSALCYDICGYQANALCLIRSIDQYVVSSENKEIDLIEDNYILNHIQKIILKKIPQAKENLDFSLNENYEGLYLFNEAVNSFYENILNGQKSDIKGKFIQVYEYYLNMGNVYISHIIYLLLTRIHVYHERSLWEKLVINPEDEESDIWIKYIKLLTHDQYEGNKVKDLNNRHSKFELWISQLRAIEKNILNNNENYVIQMPTSAGKTFIAELTIVNSLKTFPGKKCIYVAPFRALTNDKEKELSNSLSKLGYSVSSLSGSYELDDVQEYLLKETDVLITTPEKIDLLLRLNQDFFEDVSLMIVDEGHLIGVDHVDLEADISKYQRASLLEFLITKLRRKIENLRIVFISAVMPEITATEFSKWLSEKNDNVISSNLYKGFTWEPTRKLIGKFTWEKDSSRIEYLNVNQIDEENKVKRNAWIKGFIKFERIGEKQYFTERFLKAETAARLGYEFAKEGSSLIFCSKVKSTKTVGNAFLKLLKLMRKADIDIENSFTINESSESYYYAKEWYGDDSYITECIKYGIGIHFGDMYETVRKAVESDFRSGILRVLISTNTIGQGLNFPIKNIVIHSTIFRVGNEGNIDKLSFRDFWNLVGRAGRAGKETEGQVVFIINSNTDLELYEAYTNVKNIEKSNSILYLILEAFLQKRISKERFNELSKIILEPHLLNILIEEIPETEDEAVIEGIVKNSLFNVQSITAELDISPVKEQIKTVFHEVREEIVDQNLISAFGKTGFSLNSNKLINQYIDSNISSLKMAIGDNDHESLLKQLLEFFNNTELKEINSDKLQSLNLSPSAFFNVIKTWIEGNQIKEIQNEWLKVHTNIEKLNIFLSEALFYRYVWGITSFTTIFIAKTKIKREELPSNIINLSSYLKYGLNNSTACIIKSLGVNSRKASLFLADQFNTQHAEKNIIRWLANLDIEDLTQWGIENNFDVQNILEVVIKLNPNKFKNGIPTDFQFNVKGTWYSEERKELSKSLTIGQKLSLIRENDNEYDPFATQVRLNNYQLGYIPREYSKTIATEIDLNGINYIVEVIKIMPNEEYNTINVKLWKNK